MATIIRNEGVDSESSSMGLILGVLLAIVLIVLFFVYALPALRAPQGNANPGINVDVDLPGDGGNTGVPGGATAPGGAGAAY